MLLSWVAASDEDGFFSLRKVISICMGGMTSLYLSPLAGRRFSWSGPGDVLAGAAPSALISSLTGEAATLLRGEARRGSGEEEEEED